MTTEYTIKMDGKGDSDLYSSGCFGNSAHHLYRYVSQGYSIPTDPLEKKAEMRKIVSEIEARGGLSFWFPVGIGSRLGSSGQRTEILAQFDELWKPILGDWCHYEYTTGGRDLAYIVYKDSCPTKLLVNSAACIRQYEWQLDLAEIYHGLARVGNELGYELKPMVRYALASGLKPKGADLSADRMEVRPFNSHMQIPHSRITNVEDVRFLTGWTHDNYQTGRSRVDDWGDKMQSPERVRSVRSSLLTGTMFDYTGRDRLIVGRNHHTGPYDYGRCWMLAEGKRRESSWFDLEPPVVPTKPRSEPWMFTPRPATPNPTIQLRACIQELIIDEAV